MQEFHPRIPASVMYETFEDEVVVVNLRTGHYYRLTGRAQELWAAFFRAATPEAPISEAAMAATEVGVFLTALEAEGLIEPRDAISGPGANGDGEQVAILVGTSLEGTVEKFTDVKGLLLLDPIHEVDEAGWPNAAGGQT